MNKLAFVLCLAIFIAVLLVPQILANPAPDNPDFIFNTTFDFNATDSIQVNTTSFNETYNVTINTLQLDFPYAKKDDDLMAYYRFSDSGATVTDETGNHDATIVGAPVLESNGTFGGAYVFDGGNDYIDTGDPMNPTGNYFSVSSWINCGSDASIRYFVSTRSPNPPSPTFVGWDIFVHNAANGGVFYFMMDTGPSSGYRIGTSDVRDNQWHHVVAVRDDPNYYVYVDGVREDGTELQNSNTMTSVLDVIIGAPQRPQPHFIGTVDEVKIYDKALSATEVIELYNEGKQYIDTTWGGSQANFTTNTTEITTGYKLKNMTIDYSGVDIIAHNFSVDILDSAGTIVATNITNITTGTTVTYLDPYMTSGNLSSINDTNDMKIRILINGNGTSTPVIEEIYGFFEDIPPLPSFTVDNLYWIETYQDDDNARSHFTENETVIIKANLSGTVVSGQHYPNISIYSPSGAVIVSSKNMTNFSTSCPDQDIYHYNFTINVTDVGYWNITIGTESRKNIFYTGTRWVDEWNNASSYTYPFKIQVNLTNNVSTRHWEPIDVWTNFTYTAYNNSIRVAFNNSTDLIEIPSQIYNITGTYDAVIEGNVVFLASSNKSTINRTYYIFYKKTDAGAMNYINDTDLLVVNSSNYSFSNSHYTVITNGTLGGLMTEAYSTHGTNTTLAGLNPMQYTPEVEYPVGTCSMRSYTTPTIDITQGPVFTRYVVRGQLGTCSIDYNMTYMFYANSPFFLIETNVSPQAGATWETFIDQEIFFNDSLFANLTILNTSGIFVESQIAGGNGADWADLTDTYWIGMYNNTTGDGIGDIFISTSQSDASIPDVDFYDTVSYEYYKRTIISSHSASAGDYFYAKLARVIWQGKNDYRYGLNNSYNILTDPSNTTMDHESPYDTTKPFYNESATYLFLSGNISTTPNDTERITCNSYWHDDLELDYVNISENSTGTFRDHTDNNVSGTTAGWGNYTIDASDLLPANITCIFTGYDIGGLSNITNFTFEVTDVTAPNVTNISYVPFTDANLDPDTNVNVSANITDHLYVDVAILQYRANDTGTWSNITMDLWTGDLYNGTFTPTGDANWTIRVIANDTNGNENISASENISVDIDRTWYLNATAYGIVSAQSGVSTNVTNVTINNTGDIALNFSIITNSTTGFATSTIKYYGSGEYFDGTSTTNANITVDSGSTKTVEFQMTAYTNNPRSDSVNIFIGANTTTDNNTNQNCSGTFVSSISGVFFELTLAEYPSSIYQGNNSSVELKIRNIGDTTASNGWVAYTLPSDWAVGADDSVNLSLESLFDPYVDETYNNIENLTVTINAVVGDRTLFVEANSTDGGYNNASITITILDTVNTEVVDEDIAAIGPGGGGVGGGATSSQKDKLFQTEDLYEMVRGGDNSFVMTVENPYEDSDMEGVTLKVTGLLSKYITVYPEKIDKIKPGEDVNFVITINAPSYFTTGDHDLLFTIRSEIINLETGDSTDMIEERAIILGINDISRTAADDLVESARDFLKDMEDANLYISDIRGMVNNALTSLESRDYENVETLYDRIKQIYESAFTSQKLISELENNVYEADVHWGLETDKTQRIINLAKLAFSRGDYTKALERINEAQLAYGLETKGEYNVAFLFMTYWYYFLLGFLVSVVVLFLAQKRIRLSILNHRIKSLIREEQILLGLMKVIQVDTFEKNKMSMTEYIQAMIEYEKRLGKVVKDIIKYETERSHLFKLEGREGMLLDERKKIVELIKKTQTDYLTKGSYETRIYHNKMKSYSERFSEIEENLALAEAEKAMRINKFKFLERFGISAEKIFKTRKQEKTKKKIQKEIKKIKKQRVKKQEIHKKNKYNLNVLKNKYDKWIKEGEQKKKLEQKEKLKKKFIKMAEKEVKKSKKKPKKIFKEIKWRKKK